MFQRIGEPIARKQYHSPIPILAPRSDPRCLIISVMNKHQHTATLLFDACNKKRRHKSVQQHDDTKKPEKTERNEIEQNFL